MESAAFKGFLGAQSTGGYLRPVRERQYTEDDYASVRRIERAMAALDCGLPRRRFSKALMVIGDIGALILALTVSAPLSAGLSDETLHQRLLWLTSGDGLFRCAVFTMIAVSAALCFWGGLHHYANRRPFWTELRETWLVLSLGFVVDADISFLLKAEYSRLWLVFTWLCAFALVPLARILIKRRLLALGWLNRPYIVIGYGPETDDVISALASEPLMGFKPAAVVIPAADSEQGVPDVAGDGPGAQVPVCRLDALVEELLADPLAPELVFVMGETCTAKVRPVAERIALRRDDVYMVAPALGGLPLYGMEMFQFFSHEVLLLRVCNNLNRRFTRALKRCVDVLAAGTLLLLTFPLLLYVAWRIRRESPGPIIFRQQRVGYDGHHFPIFKFRSMVMDADRILEQWKVSHPGLWESYVASNFKLAEDPRITSIGRWIRRTSVDELPQLINVLRGDMSLVGPRPLLPRELEFYGESIRIYANVRPGITGLWQIGGRSNTTFAQRIALDRWYIRNWSIWHDLVILIRTIRVVFVSEGAH